eukprot:15915917-Heterocapsa_arctica.AAC.1
MAIAITHDIANIVAAVIYAPSFVSCVIGRPTGVHAQVYMTRVFCPTNMDIEQKEHGFEAQN